MFVLSFVGMSYVEIGAQTAGGGRKVIGTEARETDRSREWFVCMIRLTYFSSRISITIAETVFAYCSEIPGRVTGMHQKAISYP